MSDHCVNDDIVTYNPNYTNEHHDSSEFGDHGDDAPNDKLLIRPTILKKIVAERDVSNNKSKRAINCQNFGQNVTPSDTAFTIPCHHCGRLVNGCPKPLELDQEDECFQRTSKANLTKKLSNIFHRSSNRKTETTAEENDRNAINNEWVYCPDCRQRQIRKYYRKQRYSSHTAHIDAVMPQPTLQIQTDPNEPTKPHSSKTNTVYAGDIKTRKRKMYKHTRDLDFDKKNKQDLLKHNMKFTNRSQQYSGYAVFNSQCCQINKEGGTTSGCCKMPPVPSFWEFMFNKLSAKYQEALSLATTCDDCRPVDCKIVPHQSAKDTPSQETSETQTDRLYSETQSGAATFQRNSESQTQTNEANSGRRASIYDMLSFRPSKQTSPTTSKRMNTPKPSKSKECKCPSKNSIKVTTHDKPDMKMAFPDNNKSCQLSHDGLTHALKDKYNGEVLCIHNPPCILINGCVNLPHQTPKPLDIWQITTAWRKADPKKNLRLEICQLPSIELQCKTEKAEKFDPNICNHRSPCEVVPVCYNSNCSPDYVGSCDHDPMCNKVPVCLVETEQKITRFSCEHTPLCGDVPRSFEASELDASGKVDQESMVSDGITQVEQTLRLICHHKPPCLMIPKCLGQIMVVRRKGGAIPDCIHIPPCEYIPACGRSYVKMLAACSCSIGSRPQCRIT